MVSDRLLEHTTASLWPQMWYLQLNHFTVIFFLTLRLLFTPAAGVPVVPGLRAAPGSVGGLLLLPPHLLLLLLPRLRPLLFGHTGGAGGGAQLPRPLPLSAVRDLLWADRVSRVLSGVLRDLPSQLGGSWRVRNRLKQQTLKPMWDSLVLQWHSKRCWETHFST